MLVSTGFETSLSGNMLTLSQVNAVKLYKILLVYRFLSSAFELTQTDISDTVSPIYGYIDIRTARVCGNICTSASKPFIVICYLDIRLLIRR